MPLAHLPTAAEEAAAAAAIDHKAPSQSKAGLLYVTPFKQVVSSECTIA